ncbi:MAG: glycosyltransferase family 9 protein [Candidatus Omnitrophota bacterium]
MIRIIWRFTDKYILLGLILLLAFWDKISKPFCKSNIKSEYKKILIIKLSALGDTVMMVPIMRALRNRLPDCKISALVTGLNEEALRACPYLNRILILNLRNPRAAISVIIELRKEKFDLIIDFEQRIKLSALIAYFAGAKQTTGFVTKSYFRHYLYSNKITHKKELHEFKCMSELVKDITGEICDTSLEFWILEKDNKWAEDFLSINNLIAKRLVVLHPGCGAVYLRGARAREWSKEYFAQLATALQDKYNAQILISGSREEIGLAQEISSQMKNKPLILSGKVNIGR